MRKILGAAARTKKLFALLLLLLPGLTACAQTWPATSPTISEFTSAGDFPATTPEWVNCDMYTYFEGPDQYFLLATVYDDFSSGNWRVHVVVYDSKTGLTQQSVIEDAKHPDVVIGDYNVCTSNEPSNTNNVVGVIFENLVTSQPFIHHYLVVDRGMTSINLSQSICGGALDWSGTNPHIDIIPAPQLPVNGHPMMLPYVATYERAMPTGNQIYAAFQQLNGSHWLSAPCSTCPWDWAHSRMMIDDGIRPDVAIATDPNSPISDYKAYFVYYKSDFSQIRGAEFNSSTLTINTYSMENFATFYGYPRIEASNLQGNSSTPWHAVAECLPENNIGIEIHGYNNTGSINIVDYGLPKDEYSPTITVGNGAATLGNPSDVGNDGYITGWQVFGSELNALYLDENNTNTVSAGYDRVNFTSIGTNYGAGKNLFAMTSSSNSGIGLAAAWFDGTDIQMKLVGNSFAFKPTTVNLTHRKNVTVHPNPATNQLFVSGLNNANYFITDVLGTQVVAGSVTGNTAIDISSLPIGTYILNISGDKLAEHIKFIKE